MSKFQDLLTQIEFFIKKYYKNEMVKGALLFVSLFLLSFLVVTTLEYFGRFSPGVRTVLFYVFIIINGFVAVKYIVIPILKLLKIGNRLSMNEASQIIGDLFPDVSDKLQNTLQLSSQLDHSSANIDLLQASIQQKASSLSAVPFTTGIEIGENKKYLKYLLPILLIVFAVFVLRPNIFSDGSNRILNYSTEFIEEAPFDFLLNSDDSLMQGQSYTLKIKLSGQEIPPNVKVVSNNGSYNLKKQSGIDFEYDFSNLDNDLVFYCEANGFRSESFTVSVLQKPSISDIEIRLSYPKHMGLSNESIRDLSDITVPEGTLLEWNLKSENTVLIEGRYNDTTLRSEPNANGEFKFKRQFRKSEQYAFLLSTKQIMSADTLESGITVMPDEYPTISVLEQNDSLNPFIRFSDGIISDDFGFSKLNLIAKITRDDSVRTKRTNIKISGNLTKQIFGYSLDLRDYDLKPDDVLEYFFVVTDNDSPNGYKSVSSKKMIYSVPSLSELDNDLTEKSEELKKDMDKSLKDAKKLKEEVSKIRNNLMNKSTPDWKDKQNITNMLNQQENLQMKLEKLKQQFDENKEEENEFLENSDELKEKQDLLEKLMEELLDDEMKELLEELQKLMDEMNKDQILENMEKMEQRSDDLESELDRTLELFKHLELDKKIEGIEEQLRELSMEQEALSEETKDRKETDDVLEEQQDELNKKFDEIQKDIDEAKEMNNGLEKPKNLDFKQEQEDEIDGEMNNAKEKLSESKEKKASESQKKAADMMEQMADDVKAMMDGASSQQETEDMEQLRFLLENVVNLSHQQEDLMANFGKIDRSNPQVIRYNRDQLKIIQSTVVVRDSLMSLAKRHGELSNTIITELNDLEYNQGKAKDYGQERNLNKVKQHQQYAVTAYNDIALLLSAVLEQMQNQMKSQMPGSGSCDKPGGSGGGAPKPGQMSMQQMKDQLKKQMEKMKNGSKSGGKGGKKPGDKGEGGQGQGNGSIPGLGPKEIAKMALEQAQMRESLEKLRQELNKDGSGAGNGLNKLIDDMKDLENDLLNNGSSVNLLKRQQDIMTRLLESEKAMMERGFSEERESEVGKNEDSGNQIKLNEYNKRKEAEIELLRSVPVGLRVYYKNMINSYFNTVNN
ncbi:MAG: hypothetical protein AB8B74_01000 [Crocinitomicaceae bacterium]